MTAVLEREAIGSAELSAAARRGLVDGRGIVALVAGGRGAERLRETIDALGLDEVWCAVPSVDEEVAVAGLVRPVIMEPWPGPLEALRRLAGISRDERGGAPVLLVVAGTRPARGTAARAAAAIARGAGIVIPAKTRAAALGRRLRIRLFRRAEIRPGSGMACSAAALGALVEAGWFDRAAEPPPVAAVRRVAGTIRVLSRALERRTALRVTHSATTVTVLIPAHNEEAWIGHALRSIFAQTHPPDEVIVVDDDSSDRTGEIARALGAHVVRPAVRQGRKASALNRGLEHVRTDAVVIVDADTTLHPEAIEHLLADLDTGLDATSGSVLPLFEDSFWSRGRAIEYSLAVRVHKPMQRSLRGLLVLSGCVACWRTETLRGMGGFSERTVVEDIDGTWELQVGGGAAGYTSKAVSYTVEPSNWSFYKGQMRRWASAFAQSIAVHKLRLRKRPALALVVLTAVWDIVTSPLLALFLLVYFAMGSLTVAWWLAVWEFVLYGVAFVSALTVVGWRRTLKGFPSYMVMIWTNLYFFFEAIVREWIFRRRRAGWEMGR